MKVNLWKKLLLYRLSQNRQGEKHIQIRKGHSARNLFMTIDETPLGPVENVQGGLQLFSFRMRSFHFTYSVNQS